MSYVYSVITITEYESEGKCVVVPSLLFLYSVLIVTNVLPSSIPPLMRLFSLNLRIHQRLHSIIIQRVRLHHIDDIKPIQLPWFCIRN